MASYTTYSPYALGPEQAETACLLIHGFGGMPAKLRLLAEALAARGLRVHAMQVAGHSGGPDAMLHVGRKQWIASSEEALAQLDGYRHVILVGFSMGGMLALRLAGCYQERIAGVATLSTPTRFTGGWRLKAVPLARYVKKWFYPLTAFDLNDPEAQAEMLKQVRMHLPEVEIDFVNTQKLAELNKIVRVPVSSIDELLRLTSEVRRKLDRVRCPLLIVHSLSDQVASPACARELYRLTAATPKTLHWLEASDHLIVLGPERENVFDAVLAFIEATVPGALTSAPPDHVPTAEADGIRSHH